MTRTSRLTPELVAILAGVALTLGFATRSPARAAGAQVEESAGAEVSAEARDEMRAMLLKYTARCALAEGQFLVDSDPAGGRAPRRYPGSVGLAPQWLDGACVGDCQERVSSCLIALTNRTGKHVALSLLSAAAGMSPGMRPSAQDLPFPHQEGAFFGNMFTGQAFACRGRDAVKAPQVKRFCAVDPESCSGLAEFRDAGRCEDVCEMSCQTLSDGSQRCAAVSCRDPEGHLWRSPITTYLRNRIEAGNADQISGAHPRNEELASLDRGDSAVFEGVDFGPTPGAAARLVLAMAARRPGRIEVWLDGEQRLGAVDITPRRGVARDRVLPLPAHAITGSHALVFKVVAGRDIGRIATVEVR